MATTRNKKAIPVEAVQELADKAPQAASIGGAGGGGKTPTKTPTTNTQKPNNKQCRLLTNHTGPLRNALLWWYAN